MSADPVNPVATLAPPVPPPVLYVEPKLLKLDLGCGQNPKEGFEGVDLHAPNPMHRADLFKFPFPWADNSVAEIHTSHFLEHLPAREVEERDLLPYQGGVELFRGDLLARFVGQDFLFAFMDECWRVLKHDGTMTVIVPNARNSRGFQDPTHRRFFVAETFLYFAAEWRKMQKLDHYKTRCNFACNVGHTMPVEMNALHPEAQMRRFNESWNVIFDWVATLKAIKI